MTCGTYVLVTDKTTKDNLRHLRPSCPIAEWHSISLIGHTYVNIRISACACSLCTCSDDACTFCACISGACISCACLWIGEMCIAWRISNITSQIPSMHACFMKFSQICIHKVHDLKLKGGVKKMPGPLYALLAIDIENTPLVPKLFATKAVNVLTGVMTNP